MNVNSNNLFIRWWIIVSQQFQEGHMDIIIVVRVKLIKLDTLIITSQKEMHQLGKYHMFYVKGQNS